MASDVETLLGGLPISVKFRDGTTEKVFVREVPIRKLPDFMEAQDDEPALVELVCEKPEGWADTLTTESFEGIVRQGGDLNFPLLERWLQRKADAVKRLQPMMVRVGALATTSEKSLPDQG